jgi:hypothetical protein
LTEVTIMVVAAEWGTGQVFWSMVWFFLFFIWIYMLIAVFGDIFRSPDLGGWAKALWSVFIIVLPYLGVFVYLIARGRDMQERAMDRAGMRYGYAGGPTYGYAPDAMPTNGGGSPASEIGRLVDLRDRGAISDAEFERAKAKALA